MIYGDYNFSHSLQGGIDRLLGFLPNIIGVILLLFIGWVFARVARRLTIAVLRRLRFERSITLSPAGNYITRIVEHPTAFLGTVAYWIVFLLFISFAISALNVPALTLIVSGIYKYIPNVIAAIMIFLVASAITVGAEAFVQKMMGSGPLSRLLAAVVPAIIMPIAIFMILNQLHIAEAIVNITYTALVGSVALGLALAFGLGGRDVASEILRQAYDNAQDKTDEMKQEARDAKNNVQSQARRARGNLQDQT
jgi:hypothetical protein